MADIQIDLTADELRLVRNALNEVADGGLLEDGEFHTRLGAAKDEARDLLDRLPEPPAG